MGKYPRVVSGLTAIPSASWHDFVAACLSESGAEVTGECTTWASGNDYGTMPNWDTSLVEDMSGCDWSLVFKALAVKVHSTATFRSGTQKSDCYDDMFTALLRSTKTLGVGYSASDLYGIYVWLRFCVQPRHWELEHSRSA